MFKKIFVITLILITTSFAFSEKAEAEYPNGTSVGATLIAGYPFGVGFGVTGKFAPVPLVFNASLDFNSNRFGINLIADWWGFQLPLGQVGEADVSMYLGPGATLNFGVGFNDYDYVYVDLGIRMPVGFSFLIKKQWEIYIEPSIALNIIGFGVNSGNASFRMLGSSTDNWNFGSDILRIGGQFGFRYWF